MAYFLCRLIPPRPDFAQTMSDAERSKMMEHAAYLASHGAQGTAIAFGPVMDPKGSWGLGLFEVADEAEMKEITDNDPVIQAGLGMRYEILPMPRLIRGAVREEEHGHHH